MPLRTETAAILPTLLVSLAFGATAHAERIGDVRTGDDIQVLDRRWTLARVVDTAPMPWSVLDLPEEGSVYVAHVGVGKRHRDNVWRYDRDTFKVVAEANFRGHGVELAYDGDRLYVSESRENKLVALNPKTLDVERTYPTRSIPKDFSLSKDGETAHLALWGFGGVEEIALKTGKSKTVKTGAMARGIARAPDGRLVVMNFGADSISLVSTSPLAEVEEISLCNAPRDAVFNDSGDRLYVTCHNSDELVVFDMRERKVLDRVAVAAGPKTVALMGDDTAIVAGEDANAISVVHLTSMKVETFGIPSRRPCGVFVSPSGDRVYVTAQGSNELLVFEVESRLRPERDGA